MNRAFLCLFLLILPVAHASRPFGPNAPWNIPVAKIPAHPEAARYADLLWNGATADRPGNFNLTFDDYTYPVYEASAATGEFPVRTKWETNLNGKTMPWNPEWRPPPGSDAQVIVLDPATGREWNLWQVRFDGKTIRATNGNLVQAGEEAGDGSDPGDYRTKENGFRPSRGVGIQYLAMLVRPWEIRDGVIRHALSMPIKNPDGTFFVPPATKLENYKDRSQPGIPEGMRFSLAVSDEDIEAWLAGLPKELPESTRRAARTIAVALRDYGWFITDTSGGAHFQFEARMTAAKDWEELGLGAMPFGNSCKPPLLVDSLPTGYVVSVSTGAGKKNKCGGFAASGRPGPRMTLLLMRTARGKVLMGQGIAVLCSRRVRPSGCLRQAVFRRARASRSCPWSKPNAAQPPHLQTVNSRTALGLAPIGTIRWKNYPRDLLDGLITRERLRVYVPSDQYPK